MYNIDGINAGVLILRVAVGIVMIAHGYNHIFRGGKIEGTAGWFESLGMKPGILHAWLASLTELGAGAMLIFGFLTPLAAGGVVGVMLVALITNHLKNGFFIFRPGEGYEWPVGAHGVHVDLESDPPKLGVLVRLKNSARNCTA